MSLSPRLIRRRIRSVRNTEKITKAMELVAAAKMRRAVAAALRTRAYANLAWRMVESLEGAVGEEVHPLLRCVRSPVSGRGTPVSSVLTIVLASDRGLCGGFNAQLFRALAAHVRTAPGDARCIAVGKKSEQFIRRRGWELAASFVDLTVAPPIAWLRPIAQIAIDAFTAHEVDTVRIAFTDFVSALRQQPRIRTLLPLQQLRELTPHPAPRTPYSPDFLFAPGPRTILDAMLPRLVELQVYQAYLESGASEHSARMFAMRNASENAVEMIGDLTLTFNQARQTLITREIAEIAAGRAALQP